MPQRVWGTPYASRNLQKGETRAFVHSFVKAILVRPGLATIHYTIPMPPDSLIGGTDAPPGQGSLGLAFSTSGSAKPMSSGRNESPWPPSRRTRQPTPV